MTRLSVYQTDGSCLYPEGGTPKSKISGYFESIHFTADLSDSRNPAIEAYCRVQIPSGRNEQVFIRFDGDSVDTIFEDCRRAIKTELEEVGWKIRKPNDPSRPEQIFWTVIMAPPQRAGDVIRDTPLAKTEVDQVFREVMKEHSEPLFLDLNNYKNVGKLIHNYSDAGISLAVVENARSVDVDLILQQNPQREALTIPEETQDTLREFGKEKQNQLLEDSISVIESELKTLSDNKIPQEKVKKRLNSKLSSYYPKITISDSQSRGIAGGRNTTRHQSSQRGQQRTSTQGGTNRQRSHQPTGGSTQDGTQQPTDTNRQQSTRSGGVQRVSSVETSSTRLGSSESGSKVGRIMLVAGLITVVVVGAILAVIALVQPGLLAGLPGVGGGAGGGYSPEVGTMSNPNQLIVDINATNVSEYRITISSGGEEVDSANGSVENLSITEEFTLDSGTYNLTVGVRGSEESAWGYENTTVTIPQSTSTPTETPVSKTPTPPLQATPTPTSDSTNTTLTPTPANTPN